MLTKYIVKKMLKFISGKGSSMKTGQWRSVRPLLFGREQPTLLPIRGAVNQPGCRI